MQVHVRLLGGFEVAVDGRPAGLVALADTLKEGASAAVGKLRAMGLDVIMLTGDDARTARAIAANAQSAPT